MPTQMIRITKQAVAVSGGEEVIESGTEVESAKTFVCRDPETDFVIVLKHVVIASRGFIGDTRSGVELRGFILNECPFQSERDIVPATVIETARINVHPSVLVGDELQALRGRDAELRRCADPAPPRRGFLWGNGDTQTRVAGRW